MELAAALFVAGVCAVVCYRILTARFPPHPFPPHPLPPDPLSRPVKPPDKGSRR